MPRASASPACCQCRARKLACSRNRPACLNCQKRNESCLYPLVPGGFKKTADGKFVLIDLNDPTEIKYDIWEKNMRLKRMEANGISINPNDFKYTRNVKKDILQSNINANNGNITIGAFDEAASTFSSAMGGQSINYTADWNQQNPLSRWKRRKLNEIDSASNLVDKDLSDLNNRDLLIMKNTEIMTMPLPKLQDYTIKLVNNLKNMEEKLILSKENISLMGVDNIPIFNDLYDVLFNNNYSNVISLNDTTGVINKQIEKLKERLDFLKNELELSKENTSQNILSPSNTTVNENILDSNNLLSANKTNEISKNGIEIENFDDALFKDSPAFMLWKKNKKPSDNIYTLANLALLIPKLQELKKTLDRNLLDFKSDNNEKAEDISMDWFEPVSLKMIPFDQAVFLLDYFYNNFISDSIFPKKLFKIFESTHYKRNLNILKELNKEIISVNTSAHNGVDLDQQQKRTSVSRGRPRPQRGRLSKEQIENEETPIQDTLETDIVRVIDIKVTSKLENLLLLEYNFVILITLYLIKCNNPLKTSLRRSHFNMIEEFEKNYLKVLETNVKIFYNWCISFSKTENIDNLKIISQILSNIQDSLFYKWDLINSQDKSLVKYQIDIIRSKEQFLGSKSMIRMFDYDNRLLKQLSNNINLTDSKIDYLLEELFKQLDIGSLKTGDELFKKITITDDKSDKKLIKNIDTFLVYTNYNLYWKYYKAINFINTVKSNSSRSRRNNTSKSQILINAIKNDKSNNSSVLGDLFFTMLNTLSNTIEISSLNSIDYQYSLINSKINYIFITLVSMLYSLYDLNGLLFKEILTNLKKFIVVNSDDLSVNFKNKKCSNLLTLIDFCINNIKETEVTDEIHDQNENIKDNGDGGVKDKSQEEKDEEYDKPLTYESIIKDINDVLLSSIKASNNKLIDDLTFNSNYSNDIKKNEENLKSLCDLFI